MIGGLTLSMRISGLASGMDTDEIIKKLMNAHRIPMDKMKQKKQVLEWKRDDYRTLNSKILAFRDAAFNMKLQSSYLAKKVASSDENVISAVGTPNATNGNYSVKVQQLASGAALSTGSLSGVTSESSTFAGVLNSSDTLKIVGDKGTADITIQTTDKVSDVLNAINSKISETGVGVSYNSTLNSLMFINSTTGQASKIELSLQNSDIQTVFGITPDADDPPNVVNRTGKNAKIDINGAISDFTSNTFSVAGMTITAKQESGSVVNLNVTQDTETVFNQIKTFIDKYNELIEEANKKLSEKRYRDFQPLTDEQRKEMNEDDIKRWEEKAKSGMLVSDRTLDSGLSSFRYALSAGISGIVDGKNIGMRDIGISSTLVIGNTIRGTFLDKGKLFIDDEKLKKAIVDRPDEVMKIFTADDNDAKTDSGDGIAQRLYSQANALMSQITTKAGITGSLDSKYEIGKEMQDYDKRIDRLTRRLSDLETRYYKQFTAMETYISRMNSQSAWMAQQFSTGG